MATPPNQSRCRAVIAVAGVAAIYCAYYMVIRITHAKGPFTLSTMGISQEVVTTFDGKQGLDWVNYDLCLPLAMVDRAITKRKFLLDGPDFVGQVYYPGIEAGLE